MSNVSQVRAQFISAGTATSATALATEQDPADGTALTLTAAATTFAGPAIGGCTVQRITLTSGAGDDNSDVTYTVIGTDGMGNSIMEDAATSAATTGPNADIQFYVAGTWTDCHKHYCKWCSYHNRYFCWSTYHRSYYMLNYFCWQN